MVSLASKLRKKTEEALAKKHRMDEELRLQKATEAAKARDERRAKAEQARQLRAQLLASQRRENIKRATVKKIYQKLAKATWESETVTNLVWDFDFPPNDLVEYGILVRLNAKAINIFNPLNTSFINKIAELPEIIPKERSVLIENLLDTVMSLKEQGVLVWFEKNLNPVDFAEAAFDKESKSIQISLDNLGRRRADAISRRKIAQDNLDNEKAKISRALRQLRQKKSELEDVARKLEPLVHQISSQLAIQYPNGDLSVGTRIQFLRKTLPKLIPSYDFQELADLELLNLIRNATGYPPFESLEQAISQSNANSITCDAEEELTKRLAQIPTGQLNYWRQIERKIEAEYEELSRQGNILNDVRPIFFEKLKMLKDDWLHLNSCAEVAGHSIKDIQYIDGRYLGLASAELSPELQMVRPEVQQAYQELKWLQGEEGREFLDYLGIVFEELAEKLTRSVDLRVVEDLEMSSLVEFGGISLRATMRVDLLLILLQAAKLKLTIVTKDAGVTVVRVEW